MKEDGPNDWNIYSDLDAIIESLTHVPLAQVLVLAADGWVHLESMESTEDVILANLLEW